MIKKWLILIVLLSTGLYAQVGINTATPNAQLEIKSSNQAAPAPTDGLIIPKIDAFPTVNPTLQQQGMMVYLTTASAGKEPGFYFWDSKKTNWFDLTSDKGWNLRGNSGTSPSSHFIGTLDNADVYFRRHGVIAGFLGTSNTTFGVGALGNNTTGGNNVAIGSRALYSNNEGNLNVANGYEALYSNTTGEYNVANGAYALKNNSTGNLNVANGYAAFYYNTTGAHNTGNGAYALYNNTTGSFNVSNGFNALGQNTEGSYNVANGFNALNGNTTGGHNASNGAYALGSNTTGSFNTANGSYALGNNTTGEYNVANGYEALKSNTIGRFNIANGSAALKLNTTGNYNIALGYRAFEGNTTGNFNTILGSYATPATDGLHNFTAIGYNSGSGSSVSNTVEIGNASVVSILGQVNQSTYSDRRIKKNIRDDVPGLSFINKLRPVTYNLDIHKQNEMIRKDSKETAVDWEGKYAIEGITQTGFIAQEVAEAAKTAHFNFSGVGYPQQEDGLYSLRYAEFVVPLVKAVQEQQKIIDNQQEKIKGLEERLRILEEKFK